ncbi:GntR family transcriptional regulator [Pseudonocardia sp. CA-107938]|uniref:GntR family transcriptional regulator n=1 Tax=Pseudonocardia sp. CA-107938 TaxID=3240021 RepID=UPI003D8D90A1
MSLDPLPTDKNIGDLVADRIRDAIHDGRYPPGMRLVERTLASELGVSHIPIREALGRLSDEGLVQRLPRRGSRVAVLTSKELEELSTLRVLLEQFVVVRVQERLAPATVAELRRMVATMRKAATRGDYKQMLELDQRFHERLWALADHGMLSELVTQLRRRIGSFLHAATAALKPDELAEHAASHDVLIDAIATGDAEIARAEMARHIHIAADRIHTALRASEESAD